MTKLIVTLRLDDAAQAFFDALRTAHFPPARLVVGAHVTMFHAIPDDLEPLLIQHVASACASTNLFPVRVARLRFLGRGVAYDLASPPALQLRARIAAHFTDLLSAQDSAPWSPHITVQNKVTAEHARATQESLRGVVLPESMQAVGVGVWRYLGGPWAPVSSFGFQNGRKEAVLF